MQSVSYVPGVHRHRIHKDDTYRMANALTLQLCHLRIVLQLFMTVSLLFVPHFKKKQCQNRVDRESCTLYWKLIYVNHAILLVDIQSTNITVIFNDILWIYRYFLWKKW